jgi:hypothetical protein
MDISQSEPNNVWTRVSYKRSRPAYKEYQSQQPLAPLDDKHENQQQKDGPGNTPKPPPIYDITAISPLIQLLEQ